MDTANQEHQDKGSARTLSLPNAIVIASVIIAIGLLLSGQGGPSGKVSNTSPTPTGVIAQPQAQGQQGDPALLDKVRPVSKDDHIRGDINAPVKIVEYSDFECPFCKMFHKTLKQVMDEYGASGKVAWVYRHFPLDQLHSKARKQAEASECAAGLGGNDAFWKYTDRIYEITPSNNGLDPLELPKIAQYVGLDITKFNDCLSAGTYAKKVGDDVLNATQTGGSGTPWSVVIAKNGKKFKIGGAMPYEAVKQIIDEALAEK